MMEGFEVRAAAAHGGPEAETVRGWLRTFNRENSPEYFAKVQLPANEAVRLELFAFSGSNVIGGVLGETQFSWLKIAILAVNPAHRIKGVGTMLMSEAERIAVSRGCKYALLDTMSYQAPDFYARRGYAIAGQFPDWDSHGHTKFFFTKTLA